MAQLRDIREPEVHEGQWISRGKDHDKPVRYRIRPVPQDQDRRFRKNTVQAGKARASRNREMSELMQRAEDYSVERAVFALLDTENFSVEIGDGAAAELYGKLLEGPVSKGQEIALDGKWTEELRRHVLTRFPRLAAFISDQSAKLEEKDLEAEEEDAEAF
jgi:hypothetical protein